MYSLYITSNLHVILNTRTAADTCLRDEQENGPRHRMNHGWTAKTDLNAGIQDRAWCGNLQHALA